MTWSVRITDAKGNAPEFYHACTNCVHGGSAWPPPCYIYRANNSVGSLLTCIDTGADGHMASGFAILKCSGFEAIVKEEANATV